MALGQLLPYLLGGGAIGGFIAALRWGRQDARDSVLAASSNTTTALALRDEIQKDLAQAKVELAAMHIENTRLLLILKKHGIDPGEPHV